LDNYEPVEDRLAKFWAAHPDGRVITALIQQSPVIIFRAELYRSDDTLGEPWATGHAHQRLLERPPTGSNHRPDDAAPEWTSPYEVCETSAVGRALANAGFAPRGARPSREEMRAAYGRAVVDPHEEIARLRARVDALSPAARQAFAEWKDRQGWPWPWPSAAVMAMHRKLDETAAEEHGSAPAPGFEEAADRVAAPGTSHEEYVTSCPGLQTTQPASTSPTRAPLADGAANAARDRDAPDPDDRPVHHSHDLDPRRALVSARSASEMDTAQSATENSIVEVLGASNRSDRAPDVKSTEQPS
jgi:hypothetical protein